MKQIKGFENYLITLDGKVFSLYTMKFLKLKVTNAGYNQIQLFDGEGDYKYFSVHRLVAEAYISNPENKQYVNHVDGNKLNNCLLNLEWVTLSENMKHAYDNNLIKLSDKKLKACSENGKKNGFKNLKDRSRLILDLNNGIFYQSCTEAARIYGISHQYMSDMLSGKVKNKTSLKYV